MCALLTSAGGGLSGTWTPPVGFWARRLILDGAEATAGSQWTPAPLLARLAAEGKNVAGWRAG